MKPADEVIVLVGGRGTRLSPVLSDIPKPLAPVAGRPFLGWLLDTYAQAGMRRAILATGHLAEQVRAFAGSRWNGMQIDYSHEASPLGTGGAIRQALVQVSSEAVHVANGDSFLRYAPRALQDATEALGGGIGIALARVDDVGRYGAVNWSGGRVLGFEEKSGGGAGWVNAGRYFLTTAALQACPTDGPFSFETDVLQPAVSAGRVAGHAQTSDFIDIGMPDDYRRAQSLLAGAP